MQTRFCIIPVPEVGIGNPDNEPASRPPRVPTPWETALAGLEPEVTPSAQPAPRHFPSGKGGKRGREPETERPACESKGKSKGNSKGKPKGKGKSWSDAVVQHAANIVREDNQAKARKERKEEFF